MSLFVFGHRNPDTDAICSAIAYADFLRQTTRPDAVAASCGPPNERTEFALRQADLQPPRIIMDLRPEVVDVCQHDIRQAHESDCFYEVYHQMNEHKLRAIPVINDSGEMVGLVTLLDLMRLVLEGGVDPIKSREVFSNLRKIVDVLDGSFQNEINIDRDEDLIVSVGAMSANGFTKHMHDFPAERLVVVSGDRPTIQLPAIENGVRALVVTGGFKLSSGLMQLAQARDVTVINSPYDTATTTMRIKAARLIQSIIDTKFIPLPAKMFIEEARQLVVRSDQTVFPVFDDGELVGVLSKSDLVNPPQKQVVLVDHNEVTQAVPGVEDANIIEVLDHHRLGGSLRSPQPIRFFMDPVGSTCTLVARMYHQAQIQPTAGIALCMASGMISDTLFLRSPTTTDVDRDMLAWLQDFCDVDLKEYANKFFAVGSALRSCTPEQVVREDCKEFDENGRRFSISQIEEIGFDLFWERKDELFLALEGLAREQRLEFSALLVTDIASTGSLLMMSSEPAGWEEINYPEMEDRLYKLDAVVSRKKQLLPLIISLLDSSPAVA
ncbi:MAG: putative manganese-dependent inorganic diphosphatase [Pirellulaceae bacterium]|nr:putative manganese-dependent inorganic diphosphatase [Pirellulaceae bacterium]